MSNETTSPVGAAATPSAAPAPTPGTAPSSGGLASGTITHGDGLGFTPEQERQLASWLVQDGKLTQAEADAALAGDAGPQTAAEALGATTDEPPKLSEAEIAELDFWFPPAAEKDFVVPKLTPDGSVNAEVIAADGQIRGWLATAKFPKEIGSAIAADVARVAESHIRMSEPERQIFALSERAKLDRMWGAATESKIALGRQLVAELEARRPGIVRVLEESGAGNSAYLISQVVMHAERLQAKRRK